MNQIKNLFFYLLLFVFGLSPLFSRATMYSPDTNFALLKLTVFGIWTLLVLLPFIGGLIVLNHDIKKKEIQNVRNYKLRLIRLAIVIASAFSLWRMISLMFYSAIGYEIETVQIIFIFYVSALVLSVVGMLMGVIIDKLKSKIEKAK